MDSIFDVVHLAILAAQPGPAGIDVCTLFAGIFKWVLQIIAGGASLFLLIDMAGHMFRSPRDLRAAAIETVGLAFLIASASKAEAIIQWAIELLGAVEHCA